jgi:hypothetical protein
MFTDCGKRPCVVLNPGQLWQFLEGLSDLGDAFVQKEVDQSFHLSKEGWRLRLVLPRTLPRGVRVSNPHGWWGPATNGGGWRHCAVGYWPTEEAARTAVAEQSAVVFAEERAVLAERRRVQAEADAALNERCLREEAARAAWLVAKAEAEAAFAAAWEGGKRAEVFAAAARVGGAVSDSYIDLTLLLPSSKVYETFAKRVEGIAALEERLAAAARPVTTASLNLGGLFGGAVVVKKGR